MLASKRRLLLRGAPSVIVPNAVTYNGTTDYLTRGADFTGEADARLALFSCWLKRTATGARHNILYSAGGFIAVYVDASDKVGFEFDDPLGNPLSFAATATLTDSNWHHLAIAVNTNFAAGQKIAQVYLDDAALAGTVTDAQAAFDMDFTRTDYGIAARNSGVALWPGSLAEVWWAPGRSLDLSVTRNRRKFRSGSGHPVDLGANGQKPTGLSPILYLRNPAGSVNVNGGSGGNMTINGAPAAAASAP